MNILTNMVSTSSTLPTHTDRVPAVVLRRIRSDLLPGLSTVTFYHLNFSNFYFFSLHVTLNVWCVRDRAVPRGGVGSWGSCLG